MEEIKDEWEYVDLDTVDYISSIPKWFLNSKIFDVPIGFERDYDKYEMIFDENDNGIDFYNNGK